MCIIRRQKQSKSLGVNAITLTEPKHFEYMHCEAFIVADNEADRQFHE